MASLTRPDGAEFIISAYRETLTSKRTAKLRTKVRALAKAHGEYVALLKPGRGKLEAIFSAERGVLLGESVWDYLDRPANLIYCEKSSRNDDALLVVIQDGAVFIDTKVALDQIVTELAPILTDERLYEVCVFGDVPITETPQPGTFSLEPKRLQAFKQLSKPLFAQLPVKAQYQLQPLARQLRHRYLRPPVSVTTMILIAIALGVGFWWYFKTEPEPAPVVTQPKQVLTDPYAAYNRLLMTPAPDQELAELVSVIALTHGILGWQVKGVTLEDRTYQVPLVSAGGTREYLRKWAQENAVGITFTPKGVVMSINSKLADRPKPEQVYPLKELIDHVSDTLERTLPNQAIKIGPVSSVNNFKKVEVDVRFSTISASVLTLIGAQLRDLPVSIVSVKVTETRGLLSGLMKLIIVGS